MFLSTLSEHPAIAEALSLGSLLLFLRVTRQLKERLTWTQSSELVDPPIALPADIQIFLSYILEINANTHPNLISECWLAFQNLVWFDAPAADVVGFKLDLFTISSDLYGHFLKHGLTLRIGLTFYPISYNQIFSSVMLQGFMTSTHLFEHASTLTVRIWHTTGVNSSSNHP